MMPGSIKVVSSSGGTSIHLKQKPSIPNINIEADDTMNVILGNRASFPNGGSFRGKPQHLTTQEKEVDHFKALDAVGDGNSDSEDDLLGLGEPVQAIDPPSNMDAQLLDNRTAETGEIQGGKRAIKLQVESDVTMNVLKDAMKQEEQE